MKTHKHLTVSAATAVLLIGGLATSAAAAPSTPTAGSTSAAAAYSCSIHKSGGYWYAGHYSGLTAVPRADRVTSAGIEAQCLLRDSGYYTGAIDGYFGPQSQAAMKGYQRLINRQHGVGLAVDGWPGPQSWPWLRR